MTSQSALPSIEQYRRFYAEEIRAVAGLAQQPLLVEAFAQVPREKFLGPAPWQIYGELYMQPGAYREVQDPREVYHNVVIALKKAQSLNNGQPGALAAWIAALHLAPGQRVFHVGCGTGYYTAIMAHMVGEIGRVRRSNSMAASPSALRRISPSSPMCVPCRATARRSSSIWPM